MSLATGFMRRDSSAEGGPPGKSLGKSWVNGYPFHTLFMNTRMRAFTTAALGRHIQGKNRLR